MATSIHGWFRVRTAVIRCVSLLLSSRVCLDPFHKTEKTITGILRAPIKWQIYIHPARLTCQLLPGSGGGLLGSRRANQCGREQLGVEDHESADLDDKTQNYSYETRRYVHESLII